MSRILIVDDDPQILDLTKKILEAKGFVAVRADSSDQALFILEKFGTFDLVITDVKRPDMNGVDFSKRVKALWPNLPILMVTGGELADLPEDNPADRVLPRPMGNEAFIQAVREMLGP